PAVPVTPEEIAASALEAHAAGAAIVHIHVRDPETTGRSMELAHYAEVKERIEAAGADVIINLTTGPGATFVPGDDDPQIGGPGSNLTTPEIRTRHIEALRPEVCSLDVATMNFGANVFLNLPRHLSEMAATIKSSGVTPELECFDAGHIELAKYMIKQGDLEGPGLFQLCLGIPWGAPATVQTMAYMRDQLPDGALWSAFGISRFQMPMVAAAVLLGGQVRVGLEDNLYIEYGVLAPSNAALVEKAANIIRLMGEDIASPDDARAMIGLGK
ncbi:MAG: 3-keto-5-aminohexanoate cleavage protein, partial [Rhodospirillaceae bacterium]|nr:3-keto-5-aminohexanoate cleavage protein [Rhodospirillaceae bacterium]